MPERRLPVKCLIATALHLPLPGPFVCLPVSRFVLHVKLFRADWCLSRLQNGPYGRLRALYLLSNVILNLNSSQIQCQNAEAGQRRGGSTPRIFPCLLPGSAAGRRRRPKSGLRHDMHYSNPAAISISPQGTFDTAFPHTARPRKEP